MISFILLAFISAQGWAQITPEKVSPEKIDSSSHEISGPHLIFDDPKVDNGHLLINIGGTMSSPKDYEGFEQTAAASGYTVLGLDYPNKVITTSCRKSDQIDCFERFRNEIVYGEPGSEFTEVDRANSIEYRIESMIKARAQTDPKWRLFIKNGEIDWSKIVLSGHSQGSGHAAFLAKKHAVKGVIMIAGPQDTSAELKLAPWLSAPSATPKEHYYSLVHERDFFGSDGQIEATRQLLGEAQAPIIDVREAPCQEGNIFISRDPVRDAHNDIARSHDFEKIWSYLLNQSVGY